MMKMTKISELTGDLVEEILCRVPATSLKRLRSTCKLWNRLFEDKRFAGKHLDKSPKQIFVLTLNKFRVRSLSVHLPSVEITGELRLTDSLPDLYKFEFEQVIHCDGLLLCTNGPHSMVVIWNPLTGQTRFIQPIHTRHHPNNSYYALGPSNYGYKVLSYNCSHTPTTEFEIYDMNSNSWRLLDVAPDCRLVYATDGLSLKGKTYWFAREEKQNQGAVFLVCFDYTTETFERCPYPVGSYKHEALSTVREEKLAVLLECDFTSKTEIWVTNKLDVETKVVSWSMVLSLDLKPHLNIYYCVSFVVDEEKKVLVCCDRYSRNGKTMLYIFGEDNSVRQLDFGFGPFMSILFTYFPSFTQIQQGVGCKRKRESDMCAGTAVSKAT